MSGGQQFPGDHSSGVSGIKAKILSRENTETLKIIRK
jgi:hypothetical protein